MKKHDYDSCPICGGAARIGRQEKRGTKANPFVIFCEGADHYIEIVGSPRSSVVKRWNSLPRSDEVIATQEPPK